MSKTVLFQTIQFSTSTLINSIQPIDRTLLSVTNTGQSRSGSDSKKRVLRIPQSSNVTRASSSDCLVSYPGHSLGEYNLSAEMQSEDTHWGSLTPQQRCSQRTLIGRVLPSAEMQSEDTHWGSLISQQRCSRYILQAQPTGPPCVSVYM